MISTLKLVKKANHAHFKELDAEYDRLFALVCQPAAALRAESNANCLQDKFRRASIVYDKLMMMLDVVSDIAIEYYGWKQEKMRIEQGRWN